MVAMQGAGPAQHAVDTVADAQALLRRFEVDVRRSRLHCVREKCVDESHHRPAVPVVVRFDTPAIDLPRLDLRENPVDRQLVPVELLDRLFELSFARKQRPDLRSRFEKRLHLIEGDHVERVGRRDSEPPRSLVVREREHAKATGDISRNESHGFAIDYDLRQIHAVASQHPGERVANDAVGREPEPHEDAPQRLVTAPVLDHRDPHLVIAHDAVREQHFADAPGRESAPFSGRDDRRFGGDGPMVGRNGLGTGDSGPDARGGELRPQAHRTRPVSPGPSGLGEPVGAASAPGVDSMTRMRASTAAVSKLAGRTSASTSAWRYRSRALPDSAR